MFYVIFLEIFLTVYYVIFSFFLNCLSALASIISVHISARSDDKEEWNKFIHRVKMKEATVTPVTAKNKTHLKVDVEELAAIEKTTKEEAAGSIDATKSVVDILSWMQKWLQRRDEQSVNKEKWHHLATRIDCCLFPAFLIVLVSLTVICLVLPSYLAEMLYSVD